ncbi:MAG: PP2C family serine/threonine-protein phosphatase [Quisquiliibacterium sp.]
MRFSIFQDSDIGERSVNQDRMGYCYTKNALLMLVTDGMGGHLRGEVAAQISLQTVAAMFQKVATPQLPDPDIFLKEALEQAHRETIRYQVTHRLREAPRTTIIACIVQEGRAWWAHAGDSRLYWARAGKLLKRTVDHSKVQKLVSMGLLRPEEQKNHPDRNKVLTCIGSPFFPDIEYSGPVELRAGDRLLLCSDGLWSAFDDPLLCQRICSGSVATVTPALVTDAVQLSGRLADNATALLMSWEDADKGVDTSSGDGSVDGGVTTTIVYQRLDGDQGHEMSDEDLEKTVQEIRQAIDRGVKR